MLPSLYTNVCSILMVLWLHFKGTAPSLADVLIYNVFAGPSVLSAPSTSTTTIATIAAIATITTCTTPCWFVLYVRYATNRGRWRFSVSL